MTAAFPAGTYAHATLFSNCSPVVGNSVETKPLDFIDKPTMLLNNVSRSRHSLKTEHYNRFSYDTTYHDNLQLLTDSLILSGLRYFFLLLHRISFIRSFFLSPSPFIPSLLNAEANKERNSRVDNVKLIHVLIDAVTKYL
jgi:hypothetical protein